MTSGQIQRDDSLCPSLEGCVHGGGLESMITGSGTYYYLADGLGWNEFDFAGQQTDPTGLQYLRARYMDPETGRFMSRDPLTLFPMWPRNPYSYANGDPVVRTDPFGLADNPIAPGSTGYQCNVGWCFVTSLLWRFWVDNSGRIYELALAPGHWLEENLDDQGIATEWQVCSFVGEYRRCKPFNPRAEAAESETIRNLADIAETVFAVLAPIYGTNEAARAAAKALRWQEVGTKQGIGKGQTIFRDKKGRLYVRDLDGHKGSAWKWIDKDGNVIASLDKDLNVVKWY